MFVRVPVVGVFVRFIALTIHIPHPHWGYYRTEHKFKLCNKLPEVVLIACLKLNTTLNMNCAHCSHSSGYDYEHSLYSCGLYVL